VLAARAERRFEIPDVAHQLLKPGRFETGAWSGPTMVRSSVTWRSTMQAPIATAEVEMAMPRS
jgi:hypothetical protein